MLTQQPELRLWVLMIKRAPDCGAGRRAQYDITLSQARTGDMHALRI